MKHNEKQTILLSCLVGSSFGFWLSFQIIGCCHHKETMDQLKSIEQSISGKEADAPTQPDQP